MDFASAVPLTRPRSIARPAPIEFACPHCRAILRAPHDAAGALGDCPHCEKEARIPGGAAPEAADPLAFIPVGAPLDHEAVQAAIEQSAPERTPDVSDSAKSGSAKEEGEPAKTPIATAERSPDAAAPDGGVVFAPADGDDAAPVTFESADDSDGLPGDDAAPDKYDDEYAPAAARGPAPRRGTRRRKRGNPVLASVVLLLLLGGIGAAGWVMYDRLAGPPPVGLAATELSADAVPPASFRPPAGVDQEALRKVEAGVPFNSPVLEVLLTGTRSRSGGGGGRQPEPDAGGMTDRGGMSDAAPMDGEPDDDPADEEASDGEMAADRDDAAEPNADPPAGAPSIEEGSIRVEIRPGSAGRLVRVSPRERPEVAAWIEANTGLYGEKQLAFVKARGEFFAAVPAGKQTAEYRNSVALNVATEALGWSVEAVADGRVVPCCRETESGDLLFCIPRTAAGFTIRGRDIPGQGRVFPYEFIATLDPPPGGAGE
ncbi:hypothetical protein [Alienimonas chondri]|uniref:DUF3426 domain-containing protein n=1 Tax=Alienimonas chondri TaxID=2681879 RepID=A0ABX1V940_9PLAN|nr:hypothetical protein [Alienimonas chondri]NNJ24006.1 hypothetical protein [Alienimonas chondri]